MNKLEALRTYIETTYAGFGAVEVDANGRPDPYVKGVLDRVIRVSEEDHGSSLE